jgi:hypothetical protein
MAHAAQSGGRDNTWPPIEASAGLACCATPIATNGAHEEPKESDHAAHDCVQKTLSRLMPLTGSQVQGVDDAAAHDWCQGTLLKQAPLNMADAPH